MQSIPIMVNQCLVSDEILYSVRMLESKYILTELKLGFCLFKLPGLSGLIVANKGLWNKLNPKIDERVSELELDTARFGHLGSLKFRYLVV